MATKYPQVHIESWCQDSGEFYILYFATWNFVFWTACISLADLDLSELGTLPGIFHLAIVEFPCFQQIWSCIKLLIHLWNFLELFSNKGGK